jgi:hypothetical protein
MISDRTGSVRKISLVGNGEWTNIPKATWGIIGGVFPPELGGSTEVGFGEDSRFRNKAGRRNK